MVIVQHPFRRERDSKVVEQYDELFTSSPEPGSDYINVTASFFVSFSFFFFFFPPFPFFIINFRPILT